MKAKLIFLAQVLGGIVALVILVRTVNGWIFSENQLDVIQGTPRHIFPYEGVPGIRVEVEDKSIASVWASELILQNTGSRAIIGTGEKSDLIASALAISFEGDDPRILQASCDSEFFDVKASGEQLLIRFDQWLTGEKVRIDVLYSSASSGQPTIRTPRRDLLNGEIRIVSVVQDNRFPWSLFPPTISTTMQVASLVVTIAIASMAAFFFLRRCGRLLFFAYWWRRYGSEARIVSPSDAPVAAKWKSFFYLQNAGRLEGPKSAPKPPSVQPFLGDGLSGTIKDLFQLLILFLVSASCVLSLLNTVYYSR